MTLYRDDPRWIIVRWHGRCAKCGVTLHRGEQAFYYPITKKISATLNIYNLFDKRYYTSSNSAFYGTPRSFRLGLNVSY